MEKLNELPGMTEEQLEALSDMNIESPTDLLDALQDKEQASDVAEGLEVDKGTIDSWKDALSAIEEDVEIVEEADVVEAEEEGYVPKAKPELDADTKALLAKRNELNRTRPAFKRQEWFRYKKLGDHWRKPKGIHSKLRRCERQRPPLVRIGYRGPKEVRGLHPSGFEEVLVHNTADLNGLDPKAQAVMVGSTVGFKKRMDIENKADELGLRVLNRMG